VNVTGTASPAETALTRFRQTVSSAFVTASGLLEGEAEALPTRPRVVSRNAWGATGAKGGCKPRSSPVRGRVKAAVVHHTVSANDYSAAEAPALVLGICRYHRNANGWNDIGYNALVDRFGTVYAGRAGGLKQAVVGAHAQGFNAQTSGVASIGTHSSAAVTPAARRALVNFLAWKLASHALPAQGKATLVSAGGSASRYPSGRRVRLNRIIGHGRVGHTSCPGDRLDAQLGAIRRATQERIDSAGGATPTPPTPTVPDDGSGGLAH
jgi:uncharacterized protein with LGFP repeats